jgi:transposase
VARRRRHTKAFKLAALARMEGASDVAALAADLGIDRGLLYKWMRAYRAGGEDALRLPGERGAQQPGSAAGEVKHAASASPRVAALERKVARQALELDFFRAALQHFANRRRPGGGRGGTGSTP